MNPYYDTIQTYTIILVHKILTSLFLSPFLPCLIQFIRIFIIIIISSHDGGPLIRHVRSPALLGSTGRPTIYRNSVSPSLLSFSLSQVAILSSFSPTRSEARYTRLVGENIVNRPDKTDR